MRLHRCSRIDSRKNLRSRLVLVLLFISPLVTAQVTHDGSVTLNSDALRVSIEVDGADSSAFFRTLNDGLTTRLSFFVRMSESRPLLFGLLGPRFLAEFQLTHTAYYDPFRQAYVLDHPSGESLFSDEQQLWSAFFTLADHRIPRTAIDEPIDPQTLRVELRVTYRPVVFVPALGILSIVLSEDRSASAWTREPVTVEALW